MQQIAGYTLILQSKATFYKGDVYYFRHNKTGARICYCDTKDQEKRFQITFKTMALNNRGAAHILEHSILAQSQKYPVKNPYLEMDTRSVNTTINASTYDDHTCFYCATYNEKDFQNLMEVLSNCVFYPAVIKDERIFHQEGFRKELDSKGHLHYNGIVYNEMLGDFEDPDLYFGYQLTNLLRPNSVYSYISGGSPLEIPLLSYQELCDFYHKYYHPSRAYIHFYGHTDIEKRLAWLDKEIFSHFDKLPDIEIPDYQLTTEEEVITSSPVEQDDDTCALAICFSLPFNYPPKMSFALNELFHVSFTSSLSPFYHEFIDSNLGNLVQYSIEGGKKTTGAIILSGIKKEDQDIVIKKAKEYLVNHLNRIDHELLKTILRKRLFDANKKMVDCPNGWGEVFISDSLRWWIFDDHLVYNDYDSFLMYQELLEDVDKNYFENLYKDLFLNPRPLLLAFFTPDLDFLPKLDEQRRKQIKEDEKNLTEEEKDKLRKDSLSLEEYLKITASKEELDSLPCLYPEDLDVSMTKAIATKDGKDYHYFIPSCHIAFERIFIDISDLSFEEYSYLSILGDLFPILNKEHYTRKEINQALYDYIGSTSFYTSAYELKGDKEKFYLIIEADGYKENFTKFYKLLYDFFMTTIFDATRIKNHIESTYKQFKEKLVSDPLNYAIYKAMSPYQTSDKIRSLMNGFDYFYFLKEIRHLDVEKEIIPRLKALVEKIFVKDRMFLFYIGDKENYDVVNKASNDFRNIFKESQTHLDCLPEMNHQIHHVAYTSTLDINHIVLAYKGKTFDLKKLSILSLAMDYLSQNYLAQAIRIQGGAYSWGCGCGLDGQIYFYSAEDPHIQKTLSIFKDAPKFLKENPIDDDLLSQFKMKAIASMQENDSVWDKGLIGLKRLFREDGENPNIKQKEYFLSVSKEDIMNCAEEIQNMLDLSSYVVIGNKKEIKKHKELFDEINELKLS